jgi:hypothetical protein
MKSLYYLIAIIAFFVGAFFIITYASGYKIDITNRNISQTGMIIVEADPEATVYLNDIEQGNGKQTLRSLKPQTYNVSIKRDGYFSWTKDFELEPGEAETINDAILFKTNPEIEEYKVDQNDFFNKLADTDQITVSSNEIYQNANYVTRFSKEVSGVSWYSDRRYIAYTYENRLKIIEIDGSNEVNLLDKNSLSPVVFISSGRYVIFEKDSKVYRAKIR